jgi:hypothetical protein
MAGSCIGYCCVTEVRHIPRGLKPARDDKNVEPVGTTGVVP